MNGERPDIRQAALQARRAMTPAERGAASEAICRRLMELPEVAGAGSLAAFLSMPDEVDLRPLLAWAWQRSIRVGLPKVVGRKQPLRFFEVQPNSPLPRGPFGIEEPDPRVSPEVDPRQFDVVLVPLVAFDDHCHRIGMGAGHYDRTFAFRREDPGGTPRLVGVAFDVQRQAAWEPAAWDVTLDAVVTESVLLRIRSVRDF